MTKEIETSPYYALTLDPVHVGTGGYRLGRVDNSIVREPGTNLPKIPGTSLSGVCRANAAMATGRYQWKDSKEREGSCAGQGQDNQTKAGHCGDPHCPVCVTFGFARGNSGGFQGLAQFSDARILFFPVHSMIGPVWLTTPALVNEHIGEEVVADCRGDTIKLAHGLSVANNRLNLGWLMLRCEETEETDASLLSGSLPLLPEQIRERIVFVPDKLFSRLVNDNLEVRTSVSINPATGAAETGALYTYEAIPRATVLSFSVTYSPPEHFRIKNETPKPYEKLRMEQGTWKPDGTEKDVRWVVERGLSLCEHLGIGGMNTRGMGRVRVLNLRGTTQEGQRT